MHCGLLIPRSYAACADVRAQNCRRPITKLAIMEFHVSKEHVRRESRKAIYLIFFLAVVSAGLVAKVLSAEKISDLFFPTIGLLVFAPPILGSYKRIREGKAAYPVLELDE